MHYTTLLENVNVSCQPATIINVFVIIVKCQGKNNQSSNISQAIIVGLHVTVRDVTTRIENVKTIVGVF